MKIKKFNENLENSDKFYVFLVPKGSRTYRGSIWDNEEKPWIPDNSKMISEFECPDDYSYITISQKELNDINKIKNDIKIKDDQIKYNL